MGMYLPDGWHKHPKAHIHVLNCVIPDPAQDALQWVDQEAVTVGGRRPRPRGVTCGFLSIQRMKLEPKIAQTGSAAVGCWQFSENVSPSSLLPKKIHPEMTGAPWP